jgi:hypothetical protein
MHHYFRADPSLFPFSPNSLHPGLARTANLIPRSMSRHRNEWHMHLETDASPTENHIQLMAELGAACITLRHACVMLCK